MFCRFSLYLIHSRKCKPPPKPSTLLSTKRKKASQIIDLQGLAVLRCGTTWTTYFAGKATQSSKDKTPFIFKHSSRKHSLKDSMSGLSVGFPSQSLKEGNPGRTQHQGQGDQSQDCLVGKIRNNSVFPTHRKDYKTELSHLSKHCTA